MECLGALLDTRERSLRHATPLKIVAEWLEALGRQVSILDWSDVPLAVVLRLQDALTETSVFRLPALCALHWTRNWDRSVRALQRWRSFNGASASSDAASSAIVLLLASSRSFLERIGVSVTGTLPIAPAATRRLSSAAVRNHLGLFKWSLRLGLIGHSNSSSNGLQHQHQHRLHRHEVLAATLLTALCDRETLATAAQTLATQCLVEWIASIEATETAASTTDSDDFDMQMALLHVVASLCADVPSVGRHVLSFKPTAARASASQFPGAAATQGHEAVATADSHAWFVFLLASMAQSLGRLELLMAHHPSVWVNAVVDAACRLLETDAKTETAKRSVLRVLATTNALPRRLGCLLECVLRFAVDRQLDLLDPTAASRLQQRIPQLSPLLQAVPVLCLDAGLCLTGEDEL
ncbi:hypothetical protein PINS_up001109 [Pythium insidiosum]|nr:hypothetical protein PINS_up001109 [Pythium insidiosum]